jgi:hypothetical protein
VERLHEEFHRSAVEHAISMRDVCGDRYFLDGGWGQ